MNFQERCKQIILESEATIKEIDGKKNTPNIITEKDPETNEKTKETEDLFAELDQNDDSKDDFDETNDDTVADEAETIADEEAEFIKKFIEFTELNCLSKCYNEMFKGFSSVLGANTKHVKDVLEQHKEENKQRIEKLKEELKTQRAEIENRENALKEDAIRKLSLVSVLDKAIKKEKTKTSAETDIEPSTDINEKEQEEK